MGCTGTGPGGSPTSTASSTRSQATRSASPPAVTTTAPDPACHRPRRHPGNQRHRRLFLHRRASARDAADLATPRVVADPTTRVVEKQDLDRDTSGTSG